MTEAEWRVSESPRDMVRCLLEQHRALRRKAGRRKIRLFGCASCRLCWHLLTDRRSRAVVEYAEHLADAAADLAMRAAVEEAAQLASLEVRERVMADRRSAGVALGVIEPHIWAAGHLPRLLDQRPDQSARAHWAIDATIGEGYPEAHRAWRAALRDLACLLREIFGNPFRSAVPGRVWLTPTAVALAKSIYEERAFGQLPILGDALQEAECDDEHLLGHLRGPGPHACGCWAVDLVLGLG
jgi:hypothetical protein